MKRTKQIWVASIAWLVGLGLATQFQVNCYATYWLLLVACLFVLAIFVKSSIGYVALAIIFLLAGLFRGELSLTPKSQTNPQDLIGQKVELVGVVSDEPRWNDDKLYEFFIADARYNGVKLDGLVKIKTLSSGVFEGQTVQVEGKLGRALGKARAQIWYADVKVLNSSVSIPVRLKRTMQKGLDSALSPVAASLASGLLFGGSAQLPDNLRQATQQTGLTHIVAVSGYNLTIIIALVMTFMRGRVTFKKIVPTLILVGFFVVMTGASASVIRAAVMSFLVLIVSSQRRLLSSNVALAVTVFIMTMWDPNYLYQDLSWQLSVLALSGVIFLSPLFMPRNPNRYKIAWELFAVSLAAHLATAPLIIYTFESFSIIAPLANIIILPFIPLAMLVSFLAAAVGVLAPTAYYWLTVPFNQALITILQMIKLLAAIPHASVKLHFGLAALVVSFLGLVCLMLIGARRALKKPLQQV